MADTENIPNIDAMDDKAFDAFKSGMMSDTPPEPTPGPTPPPAPEEPAGEDDDNDEPPTPDGQAKQETVPFGRFERERLRRKEAEEAANKRVDETRAEYERRLEAVLQQLAQPRQPEQQAPTPPAEPDESDPLALIKHLREQVKKLNEGSAERSQRETEQIQQARVMDYAQREFATAAQTDPTLQQAYLYLGESLAQEARAYGVPDAELREYLRNLEVQHVNYAVQNNRKIGDYIKSVAMARGYRPQAEPAPQATQQQPAPDVSAEMQKIQRQTASLTNSGGAPARTGMPSPEELLSMSPKEFDEWRSKNDLTRAFAVN